MDSRAFLKTPRPLNYINKLFKESGIVILIKRSCLNIFIKNWKK